MRISIVLALALIISGCSRPDPARDHPATLPCGYLLDHLRLAYGGRMPKNLNTEVFIADIFEQSLELHGFHPQPGKRLKLTKDEVDAAALDVEACFR